MSNVTSPQSCGCCGDSPLSIASNVVGIVTFVAVVLTSYYAFQALVLSAPDEVSIMSKDIENTLVQTQALFIIHETGMYNADHDSQKYHDIVDESLQPLLRTMNELRDTFERLCPMIEMCSTFDLRLRRRLLWAMKRQNIFARMAQLSRQKEDFFAVQDLVALK